MPADFWSTGPIQQALREWDMGKVVAAYRVHPFHRWPLSQEQVARWLNVTQAQLSRIENGEPLTDLNRLIQWATVLGIPADQLWFKLPFGETGAVPAGAPAPLDELSQVAGNAATESLRFMRSTVTTGMADEALDHLRWEVERIAADYVHLPLENVLRELVATRDAVFRLLAKRHSPRQARELYFLAGTVCSMLAQGSHNAGNQRAARIQLRTAWMCAELAEHDALRAWVHGTAALIEEWSGSRQRAFELAVRGSRFDASRESLTRLAAIEARAAGRLGDVDRVEMALTRMSTVRARTKDQDPVVTFGGLLSFPHPKRHCYLGSVSSLIGRHNLTLAHAQEAIDAYRSGDPTERSYGDEALACLDIVYTRIATDDLDGAHEAIAPIIALPVTLRIRQLDSALGRIRQQLDSPQLTNARKAQELRELLATYREETHNHRPVLSPAG